MCEMKFVPHLHGRFMRGSNSTSSTAHFPLHRCLFIWLSLCKWPAHNYISGVYNIYLCIYTCVVHAKVLSSQLCKEAWQHLEFILIHFVRNYLKFLRCWWLFQYLHKIYTNKFLSLKCLFRVGPLCLCGRADIVGAALKCQLLAEFP